MTQAKTASRGTDDLKELLNSLEAGDELLFNDRSEPLRVCDTQGTIRHGIEVWGPRGGQYLLPMKKYGNVLKVDRNASEGFSRQASLQSLEITTRFEEQAYDVIAPSDLSEGDEIRFGDNVDIHTVKHISLYGDEDDGEYEIGLDTPAGPHSAEISDKLAYADASPADERYRIGRHETANTMYRRVD